MQKLLVIITLVALAAGAVSQVGHDSAQAQDSDRGAVVAGNTAFAFDLYQTLRSEEGNLFFSPYSIAAALAMTYGGARGDTEAAMADTLHFTLEQAALHPAFSNLRAYMPGGEGEQDFRLRIANRLWGQTGYGFLPEYVDLLNANYDAGLQELDFAADPDTARLTINDWVAGETEQRIPEFFPPDSNAINQGTRLVLTNAIYFQAAWFFPFDESDTSDDTFSRLDGSPVTVPFMRQTELLGYLAGDGYQVVVLPYANHQARMVIIVPDVGTFEAFESALDPALLESIRTGVIVHNVTLAMPRWAYTSDFDLVEALIELGMGVACSPGADFSGMTGTSDLFISAVIHQAEVAVDEAGTEASAATAVILAPSGAPQDPVILTLDRPFIYLIMDNNTDSVLFMGRVLDPSQ
ncbi:MAG: serpin family protein [Chloroflexi bacterium]|nr:serpin family protein [Chloroflexota bacterium]